MSKVIFHADMDQFFVAVEVRNNPSLKGKAVAVGGGPNGRGIITTASYEARRYGLRAGMSAMDARRLCPHVIFVRGNTSAYIYISKNVKNILLDYTDRMEMLSVDEACLDVTDTVWSYASVEDLGHRIKRRIYESEGITVSIGAGANKMVAKMASDLCKPNGFLYLPPSKVAAAYKDLPIGKLIGVGRATEPVLNALGIQTIGDLAAYPADVLKTKFGIRGPELKTLAQGGGSDRVMTHEELPDEKSVGHEMTFGDNLKTAEDIEGRLLMLTEKVARRMRVGGFAGRIVTLKLRYKGMETYVHGHKFARPLWFEGDLFAAARKLLYEIYDSSRPVRLIGVSVSGLSKTTRCQQQELFDKQTHLHTLANTCDDIKDRYGEATIGYASGLLTRSGRKSIRNPTDYNVIPFGLRG
ncbi:DNA polymerase IV [bacterium]|nr:DNA polymerase IV [bacterium]